MSFLYGKASHAIRDSPQLPPRYAPSARKVHGGNALCALSSHAKGKAPCHQSRAPLVRQSPSLSLSVTPSPGASPSSPQSGSGLHGPGRGSLKMGMMDLNGLKWGSHWLNLDKMALIGHRLRTRLMIQEPPLNRRPLVGVPVGREDRVLHQLTRHKHTLLCNYYTIAMSWQPQWTRRSYVIT